MSKELQKIENIQNISKLSVGERINYLNKLKKEIIQNEDNIYSFAVVANDGAWLHAALAASCVVGQVLNVRHRCASVPGGLLVQL